MPDTFIKKDDERVKRIRTETTEEIIDIRMLRSRKQMIRDQIDRSKLELDEINALILEFRNLGINE